MPNQDLEIIQQRFMVTLELFEAGVSMMRQKFRRDHPDATKEDIEERLRAWLLAVDDPVPPDFRIGSWPRVKE